MYTDMHQTLYELIPLISYISEDPYLSQSNEGKKLLHDYIEMSKLVEVELITRLKIIQASDKIP